jgi:DNA-directed RNA polymerase subunit L
MEIKILENEKNKLVFQLIGADHTFCNALKKELVDVKGVLIATYAVEHPQIGIPKIYIETQDSITPKKALESALVNVKKHNKEFLSVFEKAMK